MAGRVAVTGAIGFLLAALMVLVLGGLPHRLPGERGISESLLRAFFVGAVALHLLLALFDALDLSWSFGQLALVTLAVALGWRLARRASGSSTIGWLARPSLRTMRFGLGDLAALGMWLAFTRSVLRYEAVTPDFYYHWGLRAKRFLFAREFDLAFATGPSAFRFHAHYPCLWSDLLSAPGLLVDTFSIRAALLWSVVTFALLLAVARAELGRTSAPAWLSQLLFTTFALLVGGFTLVHVLGGQADWLIALALAGAVPALCRPDREGAGREIAAAAAVAAGAKVEGCVLAAILLVAHFAPRWLAARRARSSVGPLISGTGFAVAWTGASASVWLGRDLLHGLDRSGAIGGYSWSRLAAAFEAAASELASGSQGWGASTLLLATLPLFALARRTRVAATVVMAQMATYLVAYSGGAAPVADWVSMSFPRLLFHVLPATFLLAFVELARWVGEPEASKPGAEAD